MCLSDDAPEWQVGDRNNMPAERKFDEVAMPWAGSIWKRNHPPPHRPIRDELRDLQGLPAGAQPLPRLPERRGE
jgi:hypothetical protein